MVNSPLSPDQIEEYRRDGITLLPSLLDASTLGRLHEAIDSIVAGAIENGDTSILELEPEAVDGKAVARRIYDPCERHQVFRELCSDTRILDAVECLIGPDIGLHHSKLNMKPSRVGSAVEWHQDLAYFPHTNDDLVTALVYLDDASIENGCLQVIPALHHAYLDHHDETGRFSGLITDEAFTSQATPARPLPAPAGSVILMHCLLPHSSLPNRSRDGRRTLIFEYRACDALPILYSPRAANTEGKARLLRGRLARFARLAGPPPLLPRLDDNKSLYQLQEETLARQDVENPPGA